MKRRFKRVAPAICFDPRKTELHDAAMTRG
jgi:hypothetical protein